MPIEYIKLPVDGGGGGGAVDSVNGQVGIVVLTAADIGGGTPNTFTGFDGSGNLYTIPGFNIDITSGGMNINITEEPNNLNGLTLNNAIYNFEPLQNSPNENWNINFTQVNLDNANSGFNFGTNGNAVRLYNNSIANTNTGDTGEIVFTNNYFNIGNGTDPVSVKGFSYQYGFGNINANVTVNGPMQGYGFQPAINASATLTSATYVSAFYDSANIATTMNSGYISANFSPTISAVANNCNYTGINLGANVTTFNGNAGFTSLAINPTIGTFDTGGYQGLQINPTISLNKGWSAAINITMDNVTNYAGVSSTLTEQDLTFTFANPGNNNNYTLEYTPGATAGSEVVSILGNAITVQIEDGVSTATQIKAAWDGSPAGSPVPCTISGTGSDPQFVFGPNNFINGVNPGTKKAGYFDGDVEITGSLQFGGALSIGQLNAYYSLPLVSSPGQPTSAHLLISAPTVAANATVSSADFLGVNTACLMQFGANSTVTTDFIGIAALGLPAVASFGTGATVDRVSGATFALSLDASSTGGTIDKLNLCRALSIPNGVTVVNKQYGYTLDLPFGDPATTTWGVYISPDCNNFLKGSLKIGGVVDSTDTVTNSSVALEIESTTKAFVASRMTTTQRDALTAINGMVLYNTTTDKLQVYAAGSWVDLH